VVFTPRDARLRVISLRKADKREVERYEKAIESRKVQPRGRPKSADSKVAISLRLSPDTLARWKATGPGWQTRMAEVLRESV